jgi:hypothetical protein
LTFPGRAPSGQSPECGSAPKQDPAFIHRNAQAGARCAASESPGVSSTAIAAQNAGHCLNVGDYRRKAGRAARIFGPIQRMHGHGWQRSTSATSQMRWLLRQQLAQRNRAFSRHRQRRHAVDRLRQRIQAAPHPTAATPRPSACAARPGRARILPHRPGFAPPPLSPR